MIFFSIRCIFRNNSEGFIDPTLKSAIQIIISYHHSLIRGVKNYKLTYSLIKYESAVNNTKLHSNSRRSDTFLSVWQCSPSYVKLTRTQMLVFKFLFNLPLDCFSVTLCYLTSYCLLTLFICSELLSFPSKQIRKKLMLWRMT